MGGIATQGGYLYANLKVLTIKLNITTTRAARLDSAANGALGLKANEQQIVARIVKHGLEVVDDTATGAHSIAGNHDSWLGGLRQAVDHGLVNLMAVHGYKIAKSQRIAGFLNMVGALQANASAQGRCIDQGKPVL